MMRVQRKKKITPMNFQKIQKSNFKLLSKTI